MEDKEGWVYILTNEAIPGLVKIGYTMKDPAIRAEDLYKDPKAFSTSPVVPISVAVLGSGLGPRPLGGSAVAIRDCCCQA